MPNYDGLSVKTVLIIGLVVTTSFSMSKAGKQANGVCSLPRETGPCRAAIPRFYYDSQSKGCEQFSYGGCDGNKNNFKTQKECEQACKKA